MSCYITCMLAASLLGGTISTMVYNHPPELDKSLTTHQRNIYNQITKERQSNYWRGTIVGIVLGLIYFLNSGRFTKHQNICALIVIALSTAYFYYTLRPQREYLLKHLTNTAQIDAWLAHYLHKRRMYHIVFLLSGISYVLIAFALYSWN